MLCHSERWSASVFVDDEASGAALVDAIFPAQFDDHICAIDAAGILRFWDVASGTVTTIITGIENVRDFCFGSRL